MSEKNEEATTIISRRIKKGHEQEYANWFGRVADAIKRSPGFKGMTVIIPEDSGSRIILYRFVNAESMSNWENSPERKGLMSEVDKYASQTYDQASGVETFFHVGNTQS